MLTQENTFCRAETSIPFSRVELRPKNKGCLAVKSEFLSKNDHENGQIWAEGQVHGAQNNKKKSRNHPNSLEPAHL